MAQPAATPVVRLSDLRHAYPRVTALEGVRLELPAGQMSGLIGPDGVGKSTLLGIIAGVRRIQSGQVEVLGHDLRRRPGRDNLVGRIAYMPQGLGRNLYPSLSVRENLDFFGRLFGQDRATRASRIADLTAATGLAPFIDRPVYMVRIQPPVGPPYFLLDTDGDGVLDVQRDRVWENAVPQWLLHSW